MQLTKTELITLIRSNLEKMPPALNKIEETPYNHYAILLLKEITERHSELLDELDKCGD